MSNRSLRHLNDGLRKSEVHSDLALGDRIGWFGVFGGWMVGFFGVGGLACFVMSYLVGEPIGDIESDSRELIGFAQQLGELEEIGNSDLWLKFLDQSVGFRGSVGGLKSIDPLMYERLDEEWGKAKRDSFLGHINTDQVGVYKALAITAHERLVGEADRLSRGRTFYFVIGLVLLGLAGAINLLFLVKGRESRDGALGDVLVPADQQFELGSQVGSGIEIDSLPACFCEFGNDARILDWNESMSQLTGISKNRAVGESLLEVLGWDSMGDLAKTTFYRLYSGERYSGIEWVYRHPGGEDLCFSATVVPITDESGAVSGGYLVVSDMTREKERERQLELADAEKSAILSAIPDTLIRFDRDGRLVEIRDNAHVFGLEAGGLVGSMDWAEAFPDGFGELVWAGFRECLKSTRSGQFAFSGVFDGSLRHLAGKFVACGQNQVLLVLKDVGDRVAVAEIRAEAESAQLKLARMAAEDSLTGAMNYQTLVKYLEAAKAYVAQGGSLCLALVDIDRFKELNSAWGHDRGDELLCKLADLLMSSAGANDAVGRVSSEEFLWVMPEKSEKEASQAMRAVFDRWGLAEHDVTLSCGFLRVSGGELDTGAILGRLEKVMVYAQLERGNSMCWEPSTEAA